MKNKPYYPIIKESNCIVNNRTYNEVHIQLHTILTVTRLNGEKYEYDVIRRRTFKESSTTDNLKATSELYQLFLIDINNSINNIIINTEITDTFGEQIFRRIE
jgi:hypothetical protein